MTGTERAVPTLLDRLLTLTPPTRAQRLWGWVLLLLGVASALFGLSEQFVEDPAHSWHWLAGAGISLYALTQVLPLRRKRVLVALWAGSFTLLVTEIVLLMQRLPTA